MPRVEFTVTINAPQAKVIGVARDNESFPDFMPDVKSVNVLTRSDDNNVVTSSWVAEVPRFHVKIHWEEEDTWDIKAGTCTFRQLMGDYDKFEGEWTFVPLDGDKTRFDAWIDYELNIPLVGSLVKQVVHKTMVDNLKSTMYAICKRCED
jgi:uncharacterized membrane protein